MGLTDHAPIAGEPAGIALPPAQCGEHAVDGGRGFVARRFRLYRHSALAACKGRFPVLPVLTYFKYAARRVTENHHFRLAIF
ncbi:hypothetical protein EWH08_08215 [Sphingobium indicum]|uniref:Uncharacterized protein n=2 Tax=Sphingobium indicum TaxID=332055 RepID=A0A1L5BP48_SPHIB|nr:hypothetical protein [Sphingobium indicum]APL94681.1 hypothetical protein SIDU_09265 [Sphingobium indicum B90A]NYI23179.1 hypothetical protein [Sphingobium indicum]RYM04424.1 hypothetical protein EWH08_08215 [Sphingobium indicum]